MDELETLGQHLRDRVSGPFEIDGRTIGNVEMLASIRYAAYERLRLLEEAGTCCTEGPYTDGRCRFGLGKCHLVTLAQTIRRKAKQ